MAESLDDFRKRNERPRPDRIPQAQGIVREAARMSVLTNDENWDFWLSYLEAHLQATKRNAEHFNAKLRDPFVVNPDEIAKIRAALNMADTRATVLQEIMDFPKLLLQEGEKAKKLLAEMQRDVA